VRRSVFKEIYARKRTPQQEYRPNQVRFCGTRSDTRVSDEAQYSVAFVWTLTFEYCSSYEVFGVKRGRSTMHNWIHKADLQPESGKNPDHVAVDETVIRLNDEQYWLYAAVDPENELLHTSLEPTTNTVIAQTFLTQCFWLTAHSRYTLRVTEWVTISAMKNMELEMLSNVSFER